MIRKVTLQNFKRFEQQTFDLDDHIVLAGPNNSGKSTLIQAISVWQLALRRWVQEKGIQTRKKERAAIPVTRKDFTAIPLREMKLLWKDTSTSLRMGERTEGQKAGHPKPMTITLTGGDEDEMWDLGFEYRYQSSEQVYVKPSEDSIESLPKGALDTLVVHVPPFSGIGAEETRYDHPYQNLLIGQGKPGDILRNLLLEVFELERGKTTSEKPWSSLVNLIGEMFGYRLLAPEYSGRPYILCEYLQGIPTAKTGDGGLPRLDISSAGSGFHQVLVLLAFFYARPASVLLLDEPDAHLHVILQRQVYERLRSIAAERRCQLVVATHSEILIDATSPDRIESFLGSPHRLVSNTDRDQVREALKRVTAMEILLAEKADGVLYVEGERDEDLLSTWARVLMHPMSEWFRNRRFIRPLRNSTPKEGRDHFFALRGVRPGLNGFLLLDSDNKGFPERELTTQGLRVGRWKRYEAESYLIHPDAIMRYVSHYHCKSESPDMFAAPYCDAAIRYLEDHLPPNVLRDPVGGHQFMVSYPASKDLLPPLLEAAGVKKPKREYYEIAEVMKPSEISPDVTQMLDDIARSLGVM